MFKKIVLVAACVFNTVNFSNSGVAPFVTKCKLDDAACITENAVKLIPVFAAGIPDVGVETLDPAYYESIDASNNNIKFLLKEVILTGLSKCKALDLHFGQQKSKLYIKLSCPTNMDGLYELEGEVLTLKMEGHGNIHVSLQYDVNIDADIEENIGKDGKKHINISKFDYSVDLKGQSEVVFENLFPDNEELRKPVTDLLKSNGNEIVKALGDPIFKIAISRNVKSISNFFKKAPSEELYLD